ncbi:MAG: hypothetical protein C5S46_06070 [Candidatus Methanomarinus sp.]|jgi:hypothetical protein|uniref:Uncharacterized protein n=1 Tax=Candidatus Methanomarinus sp. TaxID=3386244 RepID=A0AC61SA00_9EURY|nr:hypothetical protein C5S42_06900 [ANME-2 cluster archaeon]TKY91385.1 MAG: hypothetical protein C5S46_06070 [ANME-2 cluster archaeon]
MTYTCYQLKFKAESPVFIGSKKIGIIQQTRRYIPGKTMWGAITAKVTRGLIDAGVKYSPALYRDIGKCIENCVKTTYFYPTTNNKGILIPMFTKDYLRYGQMSENEFESTFIKSFVSTSTKGDRGAAKDESLHETEYIINWIKFNGLFEQVYWTGYVFIKSCENSKYSLNNHANFEKIEVECGKYSIKLIDTLKQLFIGGDNRYGFGRLTLISQDVSKDVFGFKIKLDSLKLNINANKPIFSHLKMNDNNKETYIGDIEPLVSRVYGKKGFGRCIAPSGIAFMPGTCFKKEILDIKIKSFGILEKYDSEYS